MGLQFYESLRNGDETILQIISMGEDVGRGIGLSMQGRDYDPSRFGLRHVKRFLQTKLYTSWFARPLVNREERIYSDGMNNLSVVVALIYYSNMSDIDIN
jgi:hypothetical protein